MSKVRVRFAPSPTGFFHIGSARTALFNWLYARHCNGRFILRIEDTDKQRNTAEALDILLEGMKWLGLNWDEGPEVGGDYGPYFQSQRTHIYREYLQRLRDKGRVYDKDGAVFFKLSGSRYTVYDTFKQCEVEKVKAAPQIIDDAIRGRVERVEDQDFVIFRKNGEPVFHFVNVVDDITMGITHIIRGEDHLSNTSKHIELFKAFGVPLPQFVHIPLILNETGQGKMSKREQGASLAEYQKLSYLPQAIRSYLCLLGWSPKDDECEEVPLEEVIKRFDFSGINKSNARFNRKKLDSVNANTIRSLPSDIFYQIAYPILLDSRIITQQTDTEYLEQVLKLSQGKVTSIHGLPSFIHYFFTESYPIDEKSREKIFKKGDPLARIKELLSALESLETFNEESLQKMICELAQCNQVKTADYIHTARLALTGQSSGPSFYGLMNVLGKEQTISRLKRFLSLS
jgi:glutamyl-tRNA synthetase